MSIFSLKDDPNGYKRDQLICRILIVLTIISMMTGFYFVVEYTNSVLQSFIK